MLTRRTARSALTLRLRLSLLLLSLGLSAAGCGEGDQTAAAPPAGAALQGKTFVPPGTTPAAPASATPAQPAVAADPGSAAPADQAPQLATDAGPDSSAPAAAAPADAEKESSVAPAASDAPLLADIATNPVAIAAEAAGKSTEAIRTAEELFASGNIAAAKQALAAELDLMQDVPVEGVDDRGGKFKVISFGSLGGFVYDVDAVEASIRKTGKPRDEIPAPVRALNEQSVVVSGFMVPVEMQRQQVKSFLLVRNRMGCCFGMLLGVNEWIFVRMKDGAAANWAKDVAVAVYGKLAVGEDIDEGTVMSVYRMTAEDVAHLEGY